MKALQEYTGFVLDSGMKNFLFFAVYQTVFYLIYFF